MKIFNNPVLNVCFNIVNGNIVSEIIVNDNIYHFE